MIRHKHIKEASLLLRAKFRAAFSYAFDRLRHDAVPSGLENKAELPGFTTAIRSAETARGFGIEPRVAMLSYSPG